MRDWLTMCLGHQSTSDLQTELIGAGHLCIPGTILAEKRPTNTRSLKTYSLNTILYLSIWDIWPKSPKTYGRNTILYLSVWDANMYNLGRHSRGGRGGPKNSSRTYTNTNTTLEDIQGEEGGDINNSSRTDAADGLITTNRPQLLSSAVITFSSNTVALAQINRPALCQQSQSFPTSSEMGKKWMKHN